MKKPATFALVAGINSSEVKSGAINAAFLLILTDFVRSPPKEWGGPVYLKQYCRRVWEKTT
ncbi:MAG: hypothetical protein KKD92_11625 [Proteobacteria bacterium]|nr:hypothetical protein [Pseudomonadota bacterium]